MPEKIDKALLEQMTAWRHQLHQYPEFGFEERRTSEFIADRLSEFSLEVTRNVGNTGVVAVLQKGQSNRAIGLRADMDALKIHEANDFEYRSRHDGLMHACGHDGHSSMLLGAASYLASKGDFDGKVVFIFQPAEEHGLGAAAMIEDGLFDRFDVDAVYGLHNLPGLDQGRFSIRPGAIMASESGFEIIIQGKGGHAAMPQMGVDALLLGAQCVVALQTIVSRNLDPVKQPAVLSVTQFIGDGTVNVIPGKVVLKGDCRCFSDATVAIIEAAMRRIVSGICDAAGASCEIIFNTSFPATINTAEATAQSIKAATSVFGEEQVDGNCEAYTISEDFANMLRVKPGCYGLIGNGGDPAAGCALHNPNYDFNDSILADGASYWIQLSENLLSK